MSGQHEHKYSYLVEILMDLQMVRFLTNIINMAIIIWMIIYLNYCDGKLEKNCSLLSHIFLG